MMTMADTSQGFSEIMEQMAYDSVVEEYVAIHRQLITSDENYRSRDELKAEGRRIADDLRKRRKLMDFIAARVPPPCPTCGHTPGW